MKNIKSLFWYNKSQRKGVLFLIILIVGLQVVYFFLDDFYKSEFSDASYNKEVLLLQNQIDSLKGDNLKSKAIIFPFNPNFISDCKGYQLGMSVEEIDRLHQFRANNKYVNSKEEFQKVTKVNDSLLNKILPHFKFPDWVVKKQKSDNKNHYQSETTKKEIKISTSDINLATAEDLKTIVGIGDTRARMIINYRKKLQGYTYPYQLNEVWNLPPEVVINLLNVFEIKNKPSIMKININTASFKEVLKTPYVDYELCKKIFDYRDEVAEIQNISELKNIEGFPINKYDRIVLYLEAK